MLQSEYIVSSALVLDLRISEFRPWASNPIRCIRGALPTAAHMFRAAAAPCSYPATSVLGLGTRPHERALLRGDSDLLAWERKKFENQRCSRLTPREWSVTVGVSASSAHALAADDAETTTSPTRPRGPRCRRFCTPVPWVSQGGFMFPLSA